MAKDEKSPAFSIPNPLAVRLQSSVDERKEKEDERRDRKAQVTASRWSTIISGIATAVALLGLVVSIDQNRKTYQASQRAWVLEDSMDFEPDHPLTADQVTLIGTWVKNFGSSPATNVHGRIDFGTEGADCPLPQINRSGNSNRVLAPQQSVHLSGGQLRLNAVCIKALSEGRATLKLNGTVTYRDIFSKIMLRTTVKRTIQKATNFNLVMMAILQTNWQGTEI